MLKKIICVHLRNLWETLPITSDLWVSFVLFQPTHHKSYPIVTTIYSPADHADFR